MKIRYVFCVLFALAGLILGALTVHVSFTYRQADTVLLETPEGAQEALTGVLDAVCAGDYETAETLLYGQPSLGVNREPEDEVGKLFWDAFVSSVSYELSGDFYATDSGLARNVTVTCLDISSVTANLGQRSRAEMEKRQAQTEDISLVYDENHEFREEFVMGALLEAARQALAEDAQNKTVTFTANLVFRDGKWWVVCDSEFLSAVSGGLNG